MKTEALIYSLTVMEKKFKRFEAFRKRTVSFITP